MEKSRTTAGCVPLTCDINNDWPRALRHPMPIGHVQVQTIARLHSKAHNSVERNTNEAITRFTEGRADDPNEGVRTRYMLAM